MAPVEQGKYSFIEKEQQMSELEFLKIRKMVNEFNQLKKEYLKRYDEAYAKLFKISDAKYFSLSDSIQAVAYLVSLIEGKKYSPVTYTTLLYAEDAAKYVNFDDYKDKGVEYNIVYLISDEFKEVAQQELSQKFYINQSNLSNFDDVDQRLMAIGNNLSIPSDYYIQLLCYKDTDFLKEVYYHCDSVRHIRIEWQYRLESDICDERYSYIYDYMDSVICYRLDKENLDISLEEMMELAEKFAAEYKSDDKTLKKKL